MSKQADGATQEELEAQSDQGFRDLAGFVRFMGQSVNFYGVNSLATGGFDDLVGDGGLTIRSEPWSADKSVDIGDLVNNEYLSNKMWVWVASMNGNEYKRLQLQSAISFCLHEEVEK